ncbi:MAG TPA: Uma2 family endonuclease [Thermoanaerobaculia bacterium]|jgi:Uma2 family endonuclease
MATDPQQRLTIQEYLAFERQSETRHDYLDGEVFAMTGASRTHNLIAGNIFGEIRNQLIFG